MRPEISAALAAVIDTATAKRVEERYADDAELIADLEDVLAIEAARAGSATGETTAVLRTLPSGKQSRVPFGVRHRVLALLFVILAAAAAVGVILWLGLTRAHHGVPPLAHQTPPAKGLRADQLCQTCATDYNPDAISGPKNQNPGTVGLAIDSDLSTSWSTDQYYSGSLQKAGVGLYLDTNPGIVARAMIVHTTTPGWSLTVYARNSKPNPDTFDSGPNGWVAITSLPSVAAAQRLTLNTNGKRYRYYLVWITKLPPNHNLVTISEVTLYK
jgi:serine/threonine-protein kinase